MSILRYKNSNGQWTELPLLEGPPGMSAYEHAVAGGYDGTIEEFEEQLNAIVNIDEAEELGIDGNPIENSNNLITSGGVYSALNGKVDKVSGKGLSTNDYDTTAKAKVDAIPSTPKYTDTIYDDTTIKSRVSTIENKEAGWDAKQDAISDLTTIRNGAALGATALQSVPNTYALKTDLPSFKLDPENNVWSINNHYIAATYDYNLNDISQTYARKDSVPTKTSELTNDSGFLTEHQSLSAYRTASAQDDIDDAQDAAILAKYTKPSSGIPKTDLASAVQTSLGKADSALQEHQDISGKQDVISDLSTIRSNASAGASKISCTDAQVGSYGYIKLSDLPIYNGGVS